MISGNVYEKQLVSYCFTDENGNVLASKSSEMPMVPASNTKLVTAYLSMRRFGVSHKFTTTFEIKDNILHISGGPTFFFDPLNNEAIGQLSRFIGNTSFEKKIKIDLGEPAIDSVHYNRCWQIGDSETSDQPPISNFFVNENCKITKKIKNVYFHNSAMDHTNDQLFRPIKNSDIHFKKRVISALLMRSKEQNLIGMPVNVTTETHSAYLNDVLGHVLKESCNFYAEVLFKSLSGSERNPGSWERSLEFAKRTLNDVPYSDQISIRDGSGLCKDNFLTPIFIVNLLRDAMKRWGSSFISLLPEPGEGTLRNRLLYHKDHEIRAKTGTLFSVSALSGYIQSSGTFFSIFVNNSLFNSGERAAVIDRIVSNFIDNGKVDD